MERIAERPWWVADFDQEGRLLGDDGLEQASELAELTDLVVLCHGWNNARDAALDLYRDLFGRLVALVRPERVASVGLVGVLWPSLLLPDDVPAATGPVMNGDSGPQSTGAGAMTGPAPREAGGAEIAAALGPAFPGHEETLAEIGTLLDEAPQDGAALTRCHQLVVSLVSRRTVAASEDDGELALVGAPAKTAFEAMAGLSRAGGGAAQAGGNPFTGLWQGAKEVLRTLSYYEMKDRAGVVGGVGLGPLLARVGAARPGLRVHLAGHSFGARLVSYALTAFDPAASPAASLLLVQGAFSHFAFAPAAPLTTAGHGALAGCADRVHGPLVSTFTPNDRAVGWWYPNASLLARADSEGASSPHYRWGAVGHDGYQEVAAAAALVQPVRAPYDLAASRFTNVDVSAVVNRDLSWFSGAHSDIRHDEIAWLMASGAGLG